ncbi:MAG: hypothetical protein KAW12_16780 [Candidatus Aminicenantes bacterium]|nr:hypothetical protein [Candidatus Aminicenantes bacterium]
MIYKYEVTGEPVDTGWELPPELKEGFFTIHMEARVDPEGMIGRLEKLKAKYPGVPQIYNLLGQAYSAIGDIVKANEISRENYLLHPDYLFAKTNYAETFIGSGQYEKIAEIFDNKFDLKLLYPHRDVFHFSEVACFLGVIGMYHIFIGNLAAAENCYEVIKKAYKDHPSTKRLAECLTMMNVTMDDN